MGQLDGSEASKATDGNFDQTLDGKVQLQFLCSRFCNETKETVEGGYMCFM